MSGFLMIKISDQTLESSDGLLRFATFRSGIHIH